MEDKLSWARVWCRIAMTSACTTSSRVTKVCSCKPDTCTSNKVISHQHRHALSPCPGYKLVSDFCWTGWQKFDSKSHDICTKSNLLKKGTQYVPSSCKWLFVSAHCFSSKQEARGPSPLVLKKNNNATSLAYFLRITLSWKFKTPCGLMNSEEGRSQSIGSGTAYITTGCCQDKRSAVRDPCSISNENL